MTVPTIFETCRPREDVLKGAITEADFAAGLARVIIGKGNAEYLDPVRFFANTYPTRGLKNLLANVCRRLTGAGGEVAAIFRLDTSYGGGKTHGLIALTHAARGMNGVSNISEFVDPSLLPKGPVRIAAFYGENADPANSRTMGDGVLAFTPWGEIAYALVPKAGRLDRARAHACRWGASRRESSAPPLRPPGPSSPSPPPLGAESLRERPRLDQRAVHRKIVPFPRTMFLMFL